MSPEEVFSKLDKDNDGLLTLDEFKANKEEARATRTGGKVFAARDKDKDGKLTLDEFKPHPRREARTRQIALELFNRCLPNFFASPSLLGSSGSRPLISTIF